MSSKHRRRKKGPRPVQNDGGGGSTVQKPQVERIVCSLCNNPITEVYQSLVDAETNTNVHFDCALRILKEREPLREGESFVYLGSGTFGIVNRLPGTGPFSIRKRIPFEEKEGANPWRRRICYSL